MKLVIPIVLILVIIVVVIYLNKRKRTIVLGTEMANAHNAEQKRLSEGNYGISPMPKETYENWPKERHMYNPIFNSLLNLIIHR